MLYPRQLIHSGLLYDFILFLLCFDIYWYRFVYANTMVLLYKMQFI